MAHAKLTRAARLARRMVANKVVGRRRMQPAFNYLRDLALIGMNYGGEDFERSGEIPAMRSVRSVRPLVRVVFDVGAFRGGWATAAAKQFPEATIYAFEPSEANFQALTLKVADLRVVCTNIALADSLGARELLSVPGRPWLNSFSHRDLSRQGLMQSEAEQVACTTIDAFCAEQHIEEIDFLKIDAEGADLAVLRGAEKMLAEDRIGAVQFEMGENSIDARIFLRDFFEVLGPSFRTHRVLRDGLLPLTYSSKEEVFALANYLSLRIPDPQRIR